MSYLRRRGDASSSESSRSSQVQSTTESFDPAPGYHHDTPTSSNPIMNFLYKETWFDGNWWHVKDDTLSGIAVALAQVCPVFPSVFRRATAGTGAAHGMTQPRTDTLMYPGALTP
eukprot:TRINITY_DN2776_c0_g2_i1.p2 TRINITY_DN2776_c0_g2~~TRINITY_DN2776_c0_g2_i1.p2  ORF type:complete len:115 (-),score=11.35 TRINITY_DN2776_c0_g2_i1:298-642(-)